MNKQERSASQCRPVRWTSGLVAAAAAAVLMLGSSQAMAQQRQTIKFGVTFPLTGIAASQGEAATKAVGIALKEITDADYIGGVDLEPVFLDTEAKPDIGVRALQQAISINQVPYVITGYSSVSAAQAPLAERGKVVLVNVGGASPILSGLSPWFFNAIPLTHLQVPILLEEIIEVEGKKSVALLYRDDDLGRGVQSIYKPAAEALGGRVVAEEAFLPGTHDFRRQLARIRAMEPDMVYIAGVATEIGAVIAQGASLGLKPVWASYGAYNHKATIELGGAAANGGMYTNASNFDAELKPLDIYTKMKASWQDKFGDVSDLDYVATQMYLGVYLLADTLKVLKAENKEFTSTNIRDTMRVMTFKTIAGDMVFDEEQDALTNIAIFRLDDGQFTPTKIYTAQQVKEINERIAGR